MSNKNDYEAGEIHEAAERIEEIREQKGFKFKKPWCEHIGFPLSSYQNYASKGKSAKKLTPSVELLEAVHAKYPEVSLHWIITGKGPREIRSDEDLERDNKAVQHLKDSAHQNLILSEQLMRKYIELQDRYEKCMAELEKTKQLQH